MPNAKICFDRMLSSEIYASVPGNLLEISLLMVFETSENGSPATWNSPILDIMIEPFMATWRDSAASKLPNKEIFKISPILITYSLS